MNRATGCSRACTKRYSPQTQSGTPSVATTGERFRTARDGSSASGSPVYPHVGVDDPGLTALRTAVTAARELLRGSAPAAYAVPAYAVPVYTTASAGPCPTAADAPVGPCYAL